MDKKIKVRVRLIIPKEGKILLMYDSKDDFYYYVGGKLEFGETIEQGIEREIREECGDDTVFTMDKVLYIRDFVRPEIDEHSVELFVLGSINKFKELDNQKDPEFGDRKWLIWKDINDLPLNLKPEALTCKLIQDYKNSFPNQGEYVGNI